MSQEISKSIGQAVDMSLGRALQKARRQVHSVFFHMFNDQVYKIDQNLFSPKIDENVDEEATKPKKKRNLLARLQSNVNMEEVEEDPYKQLQLTPYEHREDEMDEVLRM